MENKPVIYSCSGCSNVAQLANQVALELDRENIVNMSCIAGLGGDVKSVIRIAKEATFVIALDGCPLHCVKNTLTRHNIVPNQHLTLSKLGFKKDQTSVCSSDDVLRVKELVKCSIL